MINDQEKLHPVCKSQLSRTACYDLLGELVRGCTANYTALHQLLIAQHQVARMTKIISKRGIATYYIQIQQSNKAIKLKGCTLKGISYLFLTDGRTFGGSRRIDGSHADGANTVISFV